VRFAAIRPSFRIAPCDGRHSAAYNPKQRATEAAPDDPPDVVALVSVGALRGRNSISLLRRLSAIIARDRLLG
jgi:hypothetical protein